MSEEKMENEKLENDVELVDNVEEDINGENTIEKETTTPPGPASEEEIRERILKSIKEKKLEEKKEVDYKLFEKKVLLVIKHIVSSIVFIGLIGLGIYFLLKYFNVI